MLCHFLGTTNGIEKFIKGGFELLACDMVKKCDVEALTPEDMMVRNIDRFI